MNSCRNLLTFPGVNMRMRTADTLVILMDTHTHTHTHTQRDVVHRLHLNWDGSYGYIDIRAAFQPVNLAWDCSFNNVFAVNGRNIGISCYVHPTAQLPGTSTKMVRVSSILHQPGSTLNVICSMIQRTVAEVEVFLVGQNRFLGTSDNPINILGYYMIEQIPAMMFQWKKDH